MKLPATKAKTSVSFSIDDIPNPIIAPIKALQLINPFENNAYEFVNLFSSRILVSPISYAVSWIIIAINVAIVLSKLSSLAVAKITPNANPSIILWRKSETKFKYPKVGLYFQLSKENNYYEIGSYCILSKCNS